MQYVLIIPFIILLLSFFFTEDVIMGIFLKKLAVDTSAEGIRKITDKLKENGMKYQLVTVKGGGSVGSFVDARAYAKSNIAMYKFSKQPGMIYYVFVSRKNYQKARELIAKG